MFIFEWLGSLSGWILWFFFEMVGNYAAAILLFTIFINILLFPFSIKRQKALASQAKLSEKQAELKKRYGNDAKRYNEEQAKLYEKEGINPFGGCVSMLLPLVLVFAIYDAVRKPLQSVLHIASEKISEALTTIKALPNIGETVKGAYEQLQLIRVFPEVRHHLTMFSAQDFSDIKRYSSGFNFFGINLLSTPNSSKFMEFVWIIPVLYFLFTILNTYITQKTSTAPQPQGPGCMKYSMYLMPLITVWLAYSWPAAVGFYMIVNLIIMSLQNIILSKYYSAQTFAAKEEAARFALLEKKESS